MLIHNVQVHWRSEYALDPIRGTVLKKEEVLQRGTISAVAHDGVTYTVGDDGSFEVPADVAAALVGENGWYEGASPFPPEKPARKARARKAKVEEEEEE